MERHQAFSTRPFSRIKCSFVVCLVFFFFFNKFKSLSGKCITLHLTQLFSHGVFVSHMGGGGVRTEGRRVSEAGVFRKPKPAAAARCAQLAEDTGH